MFFRLLFFCFVPGCFFCGDVFGQEKVKNLEALFDTLFARGDFNGCVLIAEHGTLLIEKAYGIADQSSSRPLSTRSLFEVASVSKTFTAMAVIQLKEAGKMSYDDPVNKYLPEFPYQGVTIRHLIAHTSGIPDFLGWIEPDLDVSRENTSDDIRRALYRKYESTLFAPGERFLYSNTNYAILSLLVEKISGMPFGIYLKKKIFKPAGMISTHLSPTNREEMGEDYARDYVWDAAQRRFIDADSLRTYTSYFGGIYGAYGVRSNLQDLYKWDQALKNNTLVSDSALADALTVKNPEGSGKTPIGTSGLQMQFGWQLMPHSTGGTEMFASGSYGAYTSLVVRNVSEDQTIILLSNYTDMTGVMSLMDHIEPILDGQPANFPEPIVRPKAIDLPVKIIAMLQGTFASKDTSIPQLKTRMINNRLFVKIGDAMDQLIYPETKNQFFAPATGGRIRFEVNKKGKTKKVLLLGKGTQTEMFPVK